MKCVKNISSNMSKYVCQLQNRFVVATYLRLNEFRPIACSE